MNARLCTFALVVACGRPPAELPHEELHALVDCPWVADGCEPLDGCSETEGHALDVVAPLPACGGAVPYPELLADVREQLRRKPALTSVRIVAPTPVCADAVRAVLDAPGRLETIVRPTRYVRPTVASWNGVRCGG